MNKHILLVFLTFTINTLVIAQTFQFGTAKVEYMEDTIDAVEVILDPSPKTIKSQLEKWMNDNYDVNLDGKTMLFFDKEYMTAKGVRIPEISDRKTDLYVKSIESSDSYSVLYVFSSFGYDSWIEKHSHPKEFRSLKNIVHHFVSDYLPEYYQEKLADSQDRLDRLKEDKEEVEDEIKNNNRKIKELQEQNNDLKNSLKELSQNITQQENEVSRAKEKINIINKKVKK